MTEIRTPEGVMIGVTGRPPELFLRIVTPSGLEFGWPVHKGSIGYKVAEEIVALVPLKWFDDGSRERAEACKRGNG